MHIDQVIRERRLALGLTQEELANKIGVSAPAISKWEKRVSYPDITLLPALARILGTDVNTLLTFSVTMDPEESRHLYEKMMTTAKDAGWQAAVDLAEAQIAHYPSMNSLQLMIAAFLQSLKSQIPEADWPSVYQQIVAIYQTAEKSTDLPQAQVAAQSLFYLYLKEKDFDAAEKQLTLLPPEVVAYNAMEPKLKLQRGQHKDAYISGEKLLGTGLGAVSLILNVLTQVGLADHQLAVAKRYADMSQKIDNLIPISNPYTLEAQLKVAEASNDPNQAVTIIKEVLANLNQPQPLVLQHLTPAKSKEQVSLKEAQRQLLQIFTADPEMAFLQKSPSFQQLLHQYNL